MTQAVPPTINVNFDRFTNGHNVFVPASQNNAFQTQKAQHGFYDSPAPHFAN